MSQPESRSGQTAGLDPALTDVQPAPDPLADELASLLLASGSDWVAGAAPAPALRGRLLQRVQRSARAAAAMHVVRPACQVPLTLAPGVSRHELYRTGSQAAGARPGEPCRVSLLRVQPGTRWRITPAAPALQHDWLVLEGTLELDGDGQILRRHDYRVVPDGAGGRDLHSPDGALLYWRETDPAGLPAPPDAALPLLSRADQAHWHGCAPGIRRRLLWRAGSLGAFLLHARPGAALPPHRHHHDEECLMLDGEVFLDEVLLRCGDYQLAPGGSRHLHGVSTDTGGLIYAHGDLDLLF